MYYRCQTGKCKKSGIGQEHLDGEVWKSIIHILKDPNLIKDEVKRRLSQIDMGMFKKKAHGLEKKISYVDNEINRLLDAYQENCIDLEELKTRMGKLKHNKNTLKNELDRIGIDGLTEKKMLDLKEAISLFSSKVHVSKDVLGIHEKREIVRSLVKEVVVYPEEVIIKHVVPIPRPGGEQLKSQNARLCTNSQWNEDDT